MKRHTILALGLLLALPGAAQAQSHWGVSASFSPEWRTPKEVAQLLGDSAEVSGTDFTIGFVRGRDQGGDWGFSFSRKRWDDGSGASTTEVDCTRHINGCFADGEAFASRGVSLMGVEVHKYMPFGTIKERVQIGLNLAAGVGWLSGQAERMTSFADVLATQSNGATVASQAFLAETVDISEELPPVIPMAKVHLVGAAIINSHLKLKVQTGINFPGTERVSVALVYLF
jgi:hypothetical protein